MPSTTNLCLLVDFGDSSKAAMRLCDMTDTAVMTAYHQYRKEGVYKLRAVVHEFHGTDMELGPYFVKIGHEDISVFMNASSVHEDETLIFADSHLKQEGTVVMHHFSSILTYNVSFTSQTLVGNRQALSSVNVEYELQAVSVYTNGTVFPTDTEVTFVAVTKEATPLEFVWYFGDDLPIRTTSRSIQRRLDVPQWYAVMVKASNSISSVASGPHLVRAQRRIVANRLMSTTSALVNTSVAFECRLNSGTDVAYLWNFGDGTISLGNSSTSHVYSREGEFTVEVLAFNNISSVPLRKQLFIVREPCQPPPVKNMGPMKVQVWRSQSLRLGVTFEAAILCDISQGRLSYTWTFMDSEASPVTLPAAINTNKQTIVLPRYVLEYGNYTAIAKVQIEGSVVHSNYCVGVEVRARVPISMISEGTHLFISRATQTPLILRGSQSYDPDNPGAALRYHWTCTAASLPGQPCFDDSTPYRVDMGAPTLSFPAKWLSECCDQFLVTLTVSSNGRNSSESQVFLSTHTDPDFRFVHISWVNFKDTHVNWNEELSLRAVCENCGDVQGLSYFWDLFLVNATEKNRMEVAFCSTVGLLGASALGAILKSSESNLLEDPNGTLTPFSPLPSPMAPDASPESMSRSQPIPTARFMVGSRDSFDEGPLGSEPPSLSEDMMTMILPEGTWLLPSSSPAFDDFEAYYSDIQEAVPSGGRQPGNSASLPELVPSMNAEGNPREGDNLLGPFSLGREKPTLTIDWPKTLVSPTVFRGYTSSGVTGPALTVKPYSLSSGETYVLQASVASEHGLWGKAQVYFTVNREPQDMACHVQPHHGLEAHTIFSVSCMSGKPDFRYKFSYRIGNASPHTLHHGRDTQYYFALPAGETSDDHKVMVSTEITDGQGSKARPCTVAVTVLPRYHGNDCPLTDLYHSSLKNLSTLQLVGSYMEIKNYITMVTGILSRLAKENGNTSCGQWSQIQDALISSVCKLPCTDEEAMFDSLHILRDLISFPNKLSFMSAVHILKYTQMFLAQDQFSGKFVVYKNLSLELVLLVSGVWEATKEEKMRNEDYLQEEGLKAISDVLLDCLSLSRKHQLDMATGQMEFRTRLHHTLKSSVQSLGFIQVHLPGDLACLSPAQVEMQSTCYISQLVLFKRNPYPAMQAPGQVGGSVHLMLYSCSNRRPACRGRLETPVMVEFAEEPGSDQRNAVFVLLQEKVNSHQFYGLSESPQESLQIQVEFSKPITGMFPIMLLVRFSEQPKPTDFLLKHIYTWDEHTVQIHIPATLRKGANVGYFSLLDADYDRRPPNKYFAGAVNYTVQFQWVRCLFWDKREWRSEGFFPQPGTSPGKVKCSYDRLAPFSILRRKLNASFEVNDISKLKNHSQNLLPSIFIMGSMVLYGLLVAKSRCANSGEKKKTGCIFLEENTPPGHHLYAVVIDTGFRSPATFTSKVFIALCGKNGLSGTKELCCPEKLLFQRNSRHTFVLSAPNHLGPLQKICLWHDSSGPSPNWFISHVMVKELCSGQGWFFPSQCWLAVSRGDGCVQREFTCLRCGIGFWKLFYSTFMEYLEDFHVWLSLYSHPPSSSYQHTQRLAVSFCLLCVYACLAALISAGGHGQALLDVGPTSFMVRPFSLGLLCTLLASPGAQFLSLLFRLSKEEISHPWAESQRPLRGAEMAAPQGPGPMQEPLEHPASAILSGRDSTWRTAASDSGVAHPPLELEACRTDELALGKKCNHCPSHLQAPNSSLEGRTARRSRAHLPWSGFVAWAICMSASLACGLGTGYLGYRFVPAQCMWWLYLLSLSLICCVFVTQPLMICAVALHFAWKRKDDDQFFTESLCDATKTLGLEECFGTHVCLFPSCLKTARAGEAEKVLSARQQECPQHWAQAPSAAQLRVTRERLRTESHKQAALRDTAGSMLMLLLLLFMTHGKFSSDECSLNQAIRKEFTRNARRSLEDVRSADDWWDWSLSTLLDGLHPEGPSSGASGVQPGALGGQCHLIGTSVIKQLKVSPSNTCKPHKPFSAFLEDSFSMHHPELGLENQTVTTGGPEACGVRKDFCVHSLGRTRPEAHAALTALRASGWIDHNTRAVSVHFILYNPPTRLFSSVTLSVDVLPPGGLIPSSLVESFSIFHSDSAPQYHLVLSELVLLVLNLTHLCFQLWGMTVEGLLSYWRKPRHWLELSMVGVALAYYITSGHLTTLAGDIADQLHEGLWQMFVYLSLVALWNQRARWLQGTLLFLCTLRCMLHLLGCLKMTASSSTCSFLSRVFAPALVRTLLLVTHAYLGGFLLFTWMLSSGTSADGFFGLLFCVLGRSPKDLFHDFLEPGQRAMTCYCRFLFLLLSTFCFRMLKAFLVTFFRKRKSLHRKSVVTLTDIASYMWQNVLAFLGLETPKVEEMKLAPEHNYYLEEFSSLLDELLLKINELCDRLELPPLETEFRRVVESDAEDGSIVGIAGYHTTQCVTQAQAVLELTLWKHRSYKLAGILLLQPR
uniref:polycystic kidney disease protein 1-like 1 n=1 Tax=Jaculus jaculus TaxID=51337 RepID=UPI001E1B0F3C|nr:polycystic kidney disease protein 1-like 1 [Jaculus jaculus]